MAAGILAILAIAPYLPLFVQPFISDDYLQIDLGRKYGPVEAWSRLADDALYRCRATSIVLTYWTERWFGDQPLPFYMSSILMHILNAWLVLLVGWRLGLGGIRSFVAAAFFAVYARHQEAVMWYAAMPELLVFFFCGCFLLSWDRYLRRGRAWDYGLAALWFLLALASKESAVAVVPIAAALAWRRDRSPLSVAPMAAAAVLYAAGIFYSKDNHLHLNDGTFSLHAPFVATWARSIARMFWVSGFLGLIAIAAWRRAAWRCLRAPALWIAATMLPYSFLLYMPTAPSRHVYLASAGLGFVVAVGLEAARRRFAGQRWVVPIIAAALAIHQISYVWFKKREQFLRRAAATEELIAEAGRTQELIYVTCFPYGREVAEKALEIRLHQKAEARLVFTKTPPPGVRTYCAANP